MDYTYTSALWCFTNAEGWERTAPHMQHTTLLVICKDGKLKIKHEEDEDEDEDEEEGEQGHRDGCDVSEY